MSQTTPPASSLRIAVVGQADHVDFVGPLHVLQQCSHLQFLALPVDHATLAGDDRPDLVLLAHSHPGSVPRGEIDVLRRHFPTVPMVSLLGSWCEGETRTGTPCPAVERVYWYDFVNWWQCWLRLERAELPVESPHPSHSIPDHRPATVLIDCAERTTFEALADALPAGRAAAVWVKRHIPGPLVVGPQSGIWVGGQLNDEERVQLSRFCDLLAPSNGRVVALLDFPRHDSVAQARELGATAVLGMPWREVDLATALGLASGPDAATTGERPSRAAA